MKKNFDSLSTLSNQNGLKTRNYLKDASIKDTVDYKTARVRFTRVGNVCTVHIYATLLTDKGWNKLVSCPPRYMPAYSGTVFPIYTSGDGNFGSITPSESKSLENFYGSGSWITDDDYPTSDLVG